MDAWLLLLRQQGTHLARLKNQDADWLKAERVCRQSNSFLFKIGSTCRRSIIAPSLSCVHILNSQDDGMFISLAPMQGLGERVVLKYSSGSPSSLVVATGWSRWASGCQRSSSNPSSRALAAQRG